MTYKILPYFCSFFKNMRYFRQALNKCQYSRVPKPSSDISLSIAAELEGGASSIVLKENFECGLKCSGSRKALTIGFASKD